MLHVEGEAHCARNREFTMKLTINYAYIVLIHLSLNIFPPQTNMWCTDHQVRSEFYKLDFSYKNQTIKLRLSSSIKASQTRLVRSEIRPF